MSKMQMMKPGIILLKQGTDDSQGVNQILSNISACMCVVDAIKTTLGPRGMDKIIVEENGNTTISNDGATILSKLEIVHPAAQILVGIAMAQDSEIGDGTTSVVIIAGELLKEARKYVEDGVHPGLIARTYQKASRLCVDTIKSVAVPTDETNIDVLINCASTSMSSKLIGPYKEIFSKIVVDSIMHLDSHMPLNMVGVKKVPGATMKESHLILGVAFKKTFSYAGFEMQPKSYMKPKIALLNVELELKAEKANAELRIHSVEEYQRVVDAEWRILYDKLDKIVASGAKVVLSKLVIGDVATQYFADRDIFCAGRVTEEDLTRTMSACGGSIRTVLDDFTEDSLGYCERFEEVQIGSERYNVFHDCPKSKACTIILRGCGGRFLDEVERSLHDSLMVVKKTVQYKSIVAGGGAIEMHLSRVLKKFAISLSNKEQLIVLAFSKALEVIPRQLCQNAGLDSSLILNSLRYEHSKDTTWSGVDLDNDVVRDSFAACVWEPAAIKINEICSATEVASTILTVDETVKNAKRNNQMGGR